MKNSTQKDPIVNQYQNELKGALAGTDQNCSGRPSTVGSSGAPSALVLSLALAAAALIVAGVGLSLIS